VLWRGEVQVECDRGHGVFAREHQGGGSGELCAQELDLEVV
jgi:hypothetical protein